MLDLQINGYAGVDFNADDLTIDELHQACQTLRNDGVNGILATVITADLPAMKNRLAKLAKFREEDVLIRDMILGLHIEGPFLNPEAGYIGAHPPESALPATLSVAQELLDAAAGLAKIVTLAPEQDPAAKVIRYLADQGVIVAAGHCDCSLEQLEGAIDAGLKMFTHLGNGCPLHQHRHDNIVQRALALSDRIILSFIADGAHIPLFALKNYLKCAGIENSIIVSDAISAAGCGPGHYCIADQRVTVSEDLVPWSEDRTHFVGSACPLKRMVENLQQIGLSKEQIQQLVSENPQRLLQHHESN